MLLPSAPHAHRQALGLLPVPRGASAAAGLGLGLMALGLAFAALVFMPAAVLAQAGAGPVSRGGNPPCPRGRISEIVVRSLDPYGEESTGPDATFGWAFRALNKLHFETKESVVRWELLFGEGSCLDPLRLRETERALRSLPYLQSATVTSRRLAEGGHRVDVETRDSWALSASLGVDFEEGLAVTGVQASYRNVLGYGLRTSFFRRAFRERLRYGGLVRHTNLVGSGVDAVVHGGRTRAGGYVSQSLQSPFLDEFADHGFRQVVARRDDYFGYALPPELGATPAYLRYRADLVELSYQRRFGPPGRMRGLVGIGVSHESFATDAGPSSARVVVDGDFGETVEAEPAVRDALSPQASPYATKRLTAYLGLRKVRYDVREGLDAIHAVQDVLVGEALTLAVGPGFRLTSADQADLLVRLQGRMGVNGRAHYVLTRFDAHARRTGAGSPGPDGWRDVVGSLQTDGYWTQAEWATLYLRGRVAGGWNTDRPFQLRLGGREAIRAYSEDAFPGGRLLFGSVEQRVTLDPVSPSFADMGLAVFADGGRMWAGDAPFGRDSGWQAGIGVGLRASPSGGRRVVRVDLTLPLTDLRDERGVVFRIYGEIFGVLDRRRWPAQLERSRWYGNDPDLSQRIPDPLARN